MSERSGGHSDVLLWERIAWLRADGTREAALPPLKGARFRFPLELGLLWVPCTMLVVSLEAVVSRSVQPVQIAESLIVFTLPLFCWGWLQAGYERSLRKLQALRCDSTDGDARSNHLDCASPPAMTIDSAWRWTWRCFVTSPAAVTCAWMSLKLSNSIPPPFTGSIANLGLVAIELLAYVTPAFVQLTIEHRIRSRAREQRCPNCGYPLDSISAANREGDRCPECGMEHPFKRV